MHRELKVQECDTTMLSYIQKLAIKLFLSFIYIFADKLTAFKYIELKTLFVLINEIVKFINKILLKTKLLVKL